jgi:hypothetical protein
MNIGFKQTLMALGVAALSATAFANAPVIQGVPGTIVVGDQEGNDNGVQNDFVFPTRIDLTGSVSDEDAAGIVWSYQTSGTHSYRVNNVEPLPLAATEADKVNPASILYSNTSSTNDPADNPDTYVYAHNNTYAYSDDIASDPNSAGPRTITVRNTTLSPIGGPNQAPGSVEPDGTVTGSEGVLTLIASDGDFIGQKDINVISVDGSNDGTSGGGEIISDKDFTAGIGGWVQNKADDTVYPAGNKDTVAVLEQRGTSGLCIDVGNQNETAAWTDATWSSGADNAVVTDGSFDESGFIALEQNAVYECRFTLSTPFSDAQGLADSTQPMTVLQWQDKNYTWGGSMLLGDNAGGAVSASATRGRQEFFAYLAPLCVQSDVWNNGIPLGESADYPYGLAGAFAGGVQNPEYNLDTNFFSQTTFPGLSDQVLNWGYAFDFRLQLRIFDQDITGGQQFSQLRYGDVCMGSMTITKYDVANDLSVENSIIDYSLTGSNDLQNGGTDPDAAAADTGVAAQAIGFDVSFTGGDIVFSVPGTSTDNAVAVITPGAENGVGLQAGTPLTVNDSSYPVAWEADKLLRFMVHASAGSDVNNSGYPAEAIQLNFDTPTTEINIGSFVSGRVSRSIAPGGGKTSDEYDWDYSIIGIQNPGNAPDGYAAAGPAMPKFAATEADAEPLQLFFYTHTPTVANTLNSGNSFQGVDVLRPFVQILSIPATFNVNELDLTFDDTIIHTFKVDEVSFN